MKLLKYSKEYKINAKGHISINIESVVKESMKVKGLELRKLLRNYPIEVIFDLEDKKITIDLSNLFDYVGKRLGV
ncbi:hypothetical protein ACPB8Q_05130 [Methanocaldococcus indicus]|uniref:hypothetical protein n=1 Tax=Methanocaldococcus indicus TaxID=213231 RepID=UPI003C6D6890